MTVGHTDSGKMMASVKPVSPHVVRVTRTWVSKPSMSRCRNSGLRIWSAYANKRPLCVTAHMISLIDTGDDRGTSVVEDVADGRDRLAWLLDQVSRHRGWRGCRRSR